MTRNSPVMAASKTAVFTAFISFCSSPFLLAGRAGLPCHVQLYQGIGRSG